MEQELISKKELLDRADISYGQLYRWKRKQLIPEEWFIRKSTFTGQETFFPKDKILARIDKIKQMKDERSLDELADLWSPNSVETVLSLVELRKRNIVSEVALNVMLRTEEGNDRFPFDRLLQVYVLHCMLQSGRVGLEEGAQLLRMLKEHARRVEERSAAIVFLRKMGVPVFLLLTGQTEQSDILADPGVGTLFRLELGPTIEELKIKLNKEGG